MALELEPKKGNEIDPLSELSANTLVILSDTTSGRYYKYPLPEFLSFFSKEFVAFTDQDTIEVSLDNLRKLKFGNALVITAEILTAGDVYRQVPVEIQVDSITNPTLYTVKIGGIATGRLIIS